MRFPVAQADEGMWLGLSTDADAASWIDACCPNERSAGRVSLTLESSRVRHERVEPLAPQLAVVRQAPAGSPTSYLVRHNRTARTGPLTKCVTCCPSVDGGGGDDLNVPLGTPSPHVRHGSGPASTDALPSRPSYREATKKEDEIQTRGSAAETEYRTRINSRSSLTSRRVMSQAGLRECWGLYWLAEGLELLPSTKLAGLALALTLGSVPACAPASVEHAPVSQRPTALQPDAGVVPRCSPESARTLSQQCSTGWDVPEPCRTALNLLRQGISIGLEESLIACSQEQKVVAIYLKARVERGALREADYRGRLQDVVAAADTEGLTWLAAVAERDQAISLRDSGLDLPRASHLARTACERLLNLPVHPLPSELGSHPCDLMSSERSHASQGAAGDELFLKWTLYASECETLSNRCTGVKWH